MNEPEPVRGTPRPTDRLRWRTFLLAGLIGTSCHGLSPATHPPLTVTGIVESVDRNGLNLRHKTGQRLSIAITPQTNILKRNNPAEVGDIKIGMRIVVLYRVVDGAPTAEQVRLFRTTST